MKGTKEGTIPTLRAFTENMGNLEFMPWGSDVLFEAGCPEESTFTRNPTNGTHLIILTTQYVPLSGRTFEITSDPEDERYHFIQKEPVTDEMVLEMVDAYTRYINVVE